MKLRNGKCVSELEDDLPNIARPEETHQDISVDDSLGFDQQMENLYETRMLQFEQEWVFQQCLEEDQKKEAEKQQRERETKQKDEEAKQIELAERQKEEEAIRKKEEKMEIAARQLPSEPPEQGTAGILTIKIRAPDGEVFLRRFASTDKLSVLHTFLESIGHNKQKYKAIVWPNTNLTHPALDPSTILDNFNLGSRFCIDLEENVQITLFSKVVKVQRMKYLE